MTESKVLKYYTSELTNTINAYQLTPAVTIDDIPGSLAFTDKIKALHNYHNGQRKLFLSEIEFLTMINGKLIDYNAVLIKSAKSKNYDLKKYIDAGKMMFFKGTVFNNIYSAYLMVSYGIYVCAGSATPELIEYNFAEHLEKGNYRNNILRAFCAFKNPLANEKFGFDNCFDCALAGSLIDKYIEKRGIPYPEQEEFIRRLLKKIFGRTLRIASHGYLFDSSDDCLKNGYVNGALALREARITRSSHYAKLALRNVITSWLCPSIN